MKQLFFSCWVALLAACSGANAPSMSAGAPEVEKRIQEGVGGDIASFYAKSVTTASLPADLLHTPEEYEEVENAIRDVRIHSTSGQATLFKRQGEILLVDRQKIRRADACEISRKLLTALNFRQLDLNPRNCTLVQMNVDRKSKSPEALSELIERLRRRAKYGCTQNRALRSPETCYAAISSLEKLPSTLEKVKFETRNGLRDSNFPSPVDAVTTQMDNQSPIIFVDRERLSEIPELAAVRNIFLLHELENALNSKELSDSTYNLTKELFTLWLQLP